MDPVSAVGLASSILTFVEFAVKLVTGSAKIYRSVDGALDESKQLDKAIDELDSLSGVLEQRPVCKTAAERRITRIADDCRADSKMLKDILRDIASPKNKRAFWRSMKASWMSIRSRKDVVELKDRLQGHRSEVLLHVTSLLREEQSTLGLGIAKIRDDCSQLKIEFRTDITRTRNEVLEAISALTKPDDASVMSGTSLSNISKMLLAIQNEVDETQLHHRIIRQLVFKDMNSRANQIPKAVQDTYTWMLQDGPVENRDQRSHAWNTFLEWLRTGDNVFFISGNPGSGKSTLMKFLIGQERTKEELKVWSGANALIFCVFYFWYSGSESQRTLSGLYRSLLFQTLSQLPRLVEDLFPLQVRRMRASKPGTTMEEIQGFDEDQIEEAFSLLLDRASHGRYRLCFFIDGLDECEGNRLQHEKLASMLQQWTNSGAVKLCVSSRPYSEFIGPLGIPKNRHIKLHELNESDIRAYCLERFEKDDESGNRRVLCQNLTDTVVRQAQGVFLWVYLVIDVLLIGLRQADPDAVLRDQLNALPTDLNLLYTRLREPIEADCIQRNRSNRMLLLAAHNPFSGDLTAISFSWLEEEGCNEGGLMNPDFPPSSENMPYSDEEISKRVARVTKQINGLARGFLEVITYETLVDPFFASSVQFCHRTARDYLLHNEDRHCGLLVSFPNFGESGVYTRILLAEVIYGKKPKDWQGTPTNIFCTLPQLFRNDLDPDLAGRFEIPVRSLLGPCFTFRSYHSTFGNDHWAFWNERRDLVQSNLGPNQVSFREYAAFCGLTRYVLREVAADAKGQDKISSRGNVLFAASETEECGLASDLLRLNKGSTQLCEVRNREDNMPTLTPACVLAFAEALSSITKGYVSKEKKTLATELLRFCISLKISLRFTFLSTERWQVELPFHNPKEFRVQVDAAGALEVLERLDLREYSMDGDYPPVHFDDFMFDVMEKITIEGLGRVVDAGGNTTHRQKERPHNPNDFLIDLMHNKIVLVEKIEWASEGQALVELKGWVRLY